MTLTKDVVQGVPIFKTLRLSEVKDVSSSESQNMRLEFTISNESVDRDGDSIQVRGWTLDNFVKNPVVMWAHQYDRLPVGRALKTWKSSDELKSIVQFTPDALYLDENGNDNYKGIKGSTVFNFYKAGYLNSVSCGFYPLEYEPLKGSIGTLFSKQDLIEYSCVPVPSNPGALVAREGFNQTEMKAMKKELKRWVKEAETLCACPTEKALGASEDVTGGALVPPGNNEKGDSSMKKGAISFEDAHKGGTPLAEKDDKWDSAAECAKATKAEHLKAMHAGFKGGADSDKENYDFAHHGGEPPHPVHLKAVMKIAKGFVPPKPEEPEEGEPEKKTSSGDEPGLGYSANDNKVIMDHIAQHLEEFHKPLPWDVSSKAVEEVEDVVTKEVEETKGVIGYKKYPLSKEDTWDGPAEVAKASVDDLKQMCAWFDSSQPDNKGAYKLPHHLSSGYATVWRAVAAAGAAVQGSRGGVDIPAGDMAGVQSHLAKHYAEFDKTPPWSPDAKAEAGEDTTEEVEPVVETKDLEDLEVPDGHVTKIGRTLSKANEAALNEALGHFSEGFGHHDKGLGFHDKVSKAHAKAADEHGEAMKCYNKGLEKLKSVLKAMGDKPNEGSQAEEDAESQAEEDEEQGKPMMKSVEPEPVEEVKVTEPEDDSVIIDPHELADVMKELVSEIKKEYGLSN